MPRNKNQNEVGQLNAWVPVAILVKVRILLTDPLTGGVAYRSISQLITKLLTEWLKEQEETMQTRGTI